MYGPVMYICDMCMSDLAQVQKAEHESLWEIYAFSWWLVIMRCSAAHVHV